MSSVFDKSPGYARLKRAFRQLVEDPGLGVVTAEAGVGKTASFRNLCAERVLAAQVREEAVRA